LRRSPRSSPVFEFVYLYFFLYELGLSVEKDRHIDAPAITRSSVAAELRAGGGK